MDNQEETKLISVCFEQPGWAAGEILRLRKQRDEAARRILFLEEELADCRKFIAKARG